MSEAAKRREIRANQARAEVFREYEKATKDLLFTKDFNPRIESLMHDELATIGERVLAWIMRFSWGEYSLFAIARDGKPKYQVHCCEELDLKKAAVSKTVAYLQRRGYLRDEPKLLIPVVSPAIGAGGVPEESSPQWATFIEGWRVAHSSDFQELEVARSVVSRIRGVMRSDYKKFRELERTREATLLKTSESNSETGELAVTSPFEDSNKRHQRRGKPQPANPAAEGELQLGARLRAQSYLFNEIERMQNAFKNTAFAKPPIDREDVGDRALVNRILEELGTTDEQYIVGYIIHVTAKFKGIGRGGLPNTTPRAPGMSKGPEGLGLLVNWAKDYRRIAGAPLADTEHA